MTVVIYSGAGLSAESGVPTFRGAGGLYAGLTAEEVLSAANYRQRPEEVEAIIDGLRAGVARAAPNAAHLGIAEWCHSRPETRVVTQNVDDLLERAGVPKVLHLHGEIGWLRCTNNPRHRQPSGPSRVAARRCGDCRARLRSDVVLFDEVAPRYRDLYRLLDGLGAEDVFVVIGTQGNVVRIGELLRGRPGFKILNDPEPSQDIDLSVFDEVLTAPATQAWPAIERSLRRLIGP